MENSVEKSLLGGIMYASCAQYVWEDLAERYNKIDGSRTLNLHKEIATLSQGTSSVSVYFSKLKGLWEEFEAMMPAPSCECDKSREYMLHLQKLKLFQFLMGLNDSYMQTRSQILLMSPLPYVNQAYSMITSDESQKSVVATSRILGPNRLSGNQNFEVAMYSRNGFNTGGDSATYSRNGGPQKFKKTGHLFCDYCKLKNHIRENCYKLVGYPQDSRFKKKGSNTAYNAVSEHSTS